MEEIIVHGGNRLTGRVEVEGAKNAVLPILAGAILAEDNKTILKNVPVLSDVYILSELLSNLNILNYFDEENNELTLDATGNVHSVADYDFVSKMRASIVVMGPLLARFGHAKVAMPGGCAIGTRPIDLHLKGFEALGATIETHAGYVEAKAEKLIGADIYLDFPSVGATENIMMAATLAEGKTVIKNVAREPEIVDLADFLNAMGANVQGAGTDTITIYGVEKLQGVEHAVMYDRIEAGTFMVAAAVTQGDVYIHGAVREHNLPLISKLTEMGVKFIDDKYGMRVIGPETLKPVDVKTMPHPGFPTDMQAQISVAQLLANGSSSLIETVFENRFMHLDELRKMSAKFQIERQTAILYGPTEFTGARVKATDLRAAAALVIAGLVAKGITRVTALEYLDRGYYDFHNKLAALGAEIERVDVQPVKTEKRLVQYAI